MSILGIKGLMPPSISSDIEWSWDNFQKCWSARVYCLRITWENFSDDTHQVCCGTFKRMGKQRERSVNWVRSNLREFSIVLGRELKSVEKIDEETYPE